jgi:two-component system, NarL family, nitrate/nitrite response regulator NarL
MRQRCYFVAMSTCIRIGIVDRHPLFRAGVARTLVTAGGCQVVAEGAGTEDAFRIAGQHAPDLMVLDLHSEFNPETVRRLATEFPGMRTVILTVIADEDQVVAALRAGAAGYMLKGASGPELAESIYRVHQGECYVYPSLAARLMGITVRRQTAPDRFATLTARESQILGYLTRGLSNKEIGRQLDLSEKTIKHYLSGIFDKLEVRNRVEAALLGQGRSPDGPHRSKP